MTGEQASVKDLRTKIGKIPTVFHEDTWDDRIPEQVVNGVYTNTNPTRPEGEPVSDFMLNGWDGLNGVADP